MTQLTHDMLGESSTEFLLAQSFSPEESINISKQQKQRFKTTVLVLFSCGCFSYHKKIYLAIHSYVRVIGIGWGWVEGSLHMQMNEQTKMKQLQLPTFSVLFSCILRIGVKVQNTLLLRVVSLSLCLTENVLVCT